MVSASNGISENDNGGRRSGVDRRLFSYSSHIPERRSKDKRRISYDRRTKESQDYGGIERRGFPWIESDDT